MTILMTSFDLKSTESNQNKPDECKVGLQSVPASSPIGRLRGTDNMLNVGSLKIIRLLLD